jgi:dolichol-phosphate mannosyltransferase
MSASKPYTFSIVVMAKNEGLNLPCVVKELLRRFTFDKITVVLDGDVEPAAGFLTENHVKFIKGPNQGKGAALRTAIRLLESDILVFMDADGSHQPHEIESLLDPLMNDEADMVIGSRFLGGSEELSGNMSDVLHLLGNVVGNAVINVLWNRTGRRITDAHYGFRAVKRAPFLPLALKENKFSIEQEMVIRCLKKRCRIVEVPSFELKRKYGKSHICFLHFFDFARCLFENLWR